MTFLMNRLVEIKALPHKIIKTSNLEFWSNLLIMGKHRVGKLSRAKRWAQVVVR